VSAITAIAPMIHQKCTMFAIVKANKNAQNAVKNQPIITLSTPLTLYTALSLPHDLSANAAHIATIKVTYVVDSGSLYEVAIDISILEHMSITEALTKSKAWLSEEAFTCSNLLQRKYHILFGTIFFVIFIMKMKFLTMDFERYDAPKFSFHSFWRLKSSHVSRTSFAFLESTIVSTIITPAIIRRNTFACSFLLRASMKYKFGLVIDKSAVYRV
jgi:hypothetical protein